MVLQEVVKLPWNALNNGSPRIGKSTLEYIKHGTPRSGKTTLECIKQWYSRKW
jgi:hypothetical protein